MGADDEQDATALANDLQQWNSLVVEKRCYRLQNRPVLKSDASFGDMCSKDVPLSTEDRDEDDFTFCPLDFAEQADSIFRRIPNNANAAEGEIKKKIKKKKLQATIIHEACENANEQLRCRTKPISTDVREDLGDGCSCASEPDQLISLVVIKDCRDMENLLLHGDPKRLQAHETRLAMNPLDLWGALCIKAALDHDHGDHISAHGDTIASHVSMSSSFCSSHESHKSGTSIEQAVQQKEHQKPNSAITSSTDCSSSCSIEKSSCQQMLNNKPQMEELNQHQSSGTEGPLLSSISLSSSTDRGSHSENAHEETGKDHDPGCNSKEKLYIQQQRRPHHWYWPSAPNLKLKLFSRRNINITTTRAHCCSESDGHNTDRSSHSNHPRHPHRRWGISNPYFGPRLPSNHQSH